MAIDAETRQIVMCWNKLHCPETTPYAGLQQKYFEHEAKHGRDQGRRQLFRKLQRLSDTAWVILAKYDSPWQDRDAYQEIRRKASEEGSGVTSDDLASMRHICMVWIGMNE